MQIMMLLDKRVHLWSHRIEKILNVLFGQGKEIVDNLNIRLVKLLISNLIIVLSIIVSVVTSLGI